MGDKATDLALEVIKRFEGCHHLRDDGLYGPYLCPANVPTIGWGTVVPSMAHPPISQAEADRLLEQETVRALASALKLAPNLSRYPHRLAAVASFIYNLGSGRFKTSTLRRRILAEDWEGAAGEFGKWVFGGGRKLPGLVKRRAAEAALFSSFDDGYRSGLAAVR